MSYNPAILGIYTQKPSQTKVFRLLFVLRTCQPCGNYSYLWMQVAGVGVLYKHKSLFSFWSRQCFICVLRDEAPWTMDYVQTPP